MGSILRSPRRKVLLPTAALMLVAGALLSFGVGAGAKGLKTVTATAPVSHFTCYTASSPNLPNETVVLTNQFDTNLSATLGDVSWHCNPVEKTVTNAAGTKAVTPIVNPDDHLLCRYVATLTQPSFTVLVNNQFGDAELTTGQPQWLCLPSWKSEGAATSCSGCVSIPQTQVQPPGLDHYLCYQASYTQSSSGSNVLAFSLPSSLKLQDEFMSKAVKATLGPPNYLCLPTVKTTAAGTEVGLVNPGVHLVCFPLTASVTPPTSITDQIQFGVAAVTINNLSELCVPSTKQIIGATPVVTSTTGTVTVSAVNASTGIALIDATFSASENGAVVGTCTTDETGTCMISLPPAGGAATIAVTGAPAGSMATGTWQSVQPVGGGYTITSFFDVFTETTVP